MILSGSQASAANLRQTLLDRIGYAVRQSGGSPILSLDPRRATRLYALGHDDFERLVGYAGRKPVGEHEPGLELAASSIPRSAGWAGESIVRDGADPLDLKIIEFSNRLRLDNFLALSDSLTYSTDVQIGLRAYLDSPRLTIAQTTVHAGTGQEFVVSQAIDLLRNDLRVIVSPGQSSAARFAFELNRGMLDTYFETAVLSQTQAFTNITTTIPVSTDTIFKVAINEGISITVLRPGDVQSLTALTIDSGSLALITAALKRNDLVVVPSRPVQIDGTQRIGWYEINLDTGATIGVLDDGGHGVDEYGTVQLFVKGLVTGLTIDFGIEFASYLLHKANPNIPNVGPGVSGFVSFLPLFRDILLRHPPGIVFALVPYLGFVIGFALSQALLQLVENGLKSVGIDPPLLPIEIGPRLGDVLAQANVSESVSAPSTSKAGQARGTAVAANMDFVGKLTALWSSDAFSNTGISLLSAGQATLSDASHRIVGSGALGLSAPARVVASVAGRGDYQVTGVGGLSFYGPAEASLGVSGDWQNYTATVTGPNLSITLTTLAAGDLTLNGQALPAGTYTITTNSATLSGSGNTHPQPSPARSRSPRPTARSIWAGKGTSRRRRQTARSRPDEPTLDGYTGTDQRRGGWRQWHRRRHAQRQRSQVLPSRRAPRRSPPTRTRR